VCHTGGSQSYESEHQLRNFTATGWRFSLVVRSLVADLLLDPDNTRPKYHVLAMWKGLRNRQAVFYLDAKFTFSVLCRHSIDSWQTQLRMVKIEDSIPQMCAAYHERTPTRYWFPGRDEKSPKYDLAAVAVVYPRTTTSCY
jgi:hypothetical protein